VLLFVRQRASGIMIQRPSSPEALVTRARAREQTEEFAKVAREEAQEVSLAMGPWFARIIMLPSHTMSLLIWLRLLGLIHRQDPQETNERVCWNGGRIRRG
jgi:hypothetical protein